MQNKRGLSGIIVALILILLSLVAAGIVWVVVQNVLKQGTENISLGNFFLDLQIKKAQVDPATGNLQVTVYRGAGEADLSGIVFIVSDGTNSQTIKKESSLAELGTATFDLSPSDFSEEAFVKGVSIAPVTTNTNGKEQVGKEVDSLTFTNKQLLENLGAIAWWKLDGNTQDSIGGHDGTFVNSPTTVEGEYGQAYYFNGAASPNSQYIQVPNFPALNGPVTISMWVKVTSQTESWEDVISIGQNRRIEIANKGNKGFWCYRGIAANNVWTADQWVHLICTFDAKTTIYVNGVKKAGTGGGGTDFPWTSTTLKFGTIRSSETFDGALDEVVVFNKALTAEQVKGLYTLDLTSAN